MVNRMVSYAQNGEDVVLARALRHVERGTYLDIGANDPEVTSVTRAFYERGWSGLCVEPGPLLAQKFREERPRDTLVQAAVSDRDDATLTFYLIGDTGLSTVRADIAQEHADNGFVVDEITVRSIRLDAAVEQAGFAGKEIHFATIDTEGSESAVLRSGSWTSIRPWILLIEATQPRSTQPVHEQWERIVLDAGYRFCLFDGLSRFYVDEVNHPELIPDLSYPAGVFDDFVTIDQLRLEQRAEELEQQASAARREADERLLEVELMHASTSWRVTAPLRAVRRRLPRRRKR